MKTTEKEIKRITDKINKLLKNNPLAFPSIAAADWAVNNYKNEDWLEYEKQTGNFRVNYQQPKNGLEALIDKSTGYEEQQTINYAKFTLWWVEGFIEGIDEEFKKF